MKEEKQTYEYICFTELVYEFEFTDKKEIEKKIKRRLRYSSLGEYSQERVEYIRKVKNELKAELHSGVKSAYFHKSQSVYADLKDFDRERMKTDFHKTYGKLDEQDLLWAL